MHFALFDLDCLDLLSYSKQEKEGFYMSANLEYVRQAMLWYLSYMLRHVRIQTFSSGVGPPPSKSNCFFRGMGCRISISKESCSHFSHMRFSSGEERF